MSALAPVLCTPIRLDQTEYSSVEHVGPEHSRIVI